MNTETTALFRKKIRREARRHKLDVETIADAVHGIQYLKQGLERDASYYLKGKSPKVLEVASNIVDFMSDLEAMSK